MLTPWLSGRLCPARKGVYLRDHISWGESYSLWDGQLWMFPGRTAVEAAPQDVPSDVQNCRWRGLDADPMTAGRTSKGQP